MLPAHRALALGANPMFLAMQLVGGSDGASTVEFNPCHQRMCSHGQILPAHGRTQIRTRRAATPTVADGHIKAPKPLLLPTIEVIGMRVARLATGLQPRHMQRVTQRPVRGLQLPGIAAVVTAALAPPLGALEVRQYLTVTQPAAPSSRQRSKSSGLPRTYTMPFMDEDLAENFAPRRPQPPPAEMRLRFSLEAPVISRHVHRNRQCGRHLYVDRAIRATVLKHQYAVAAVFTDTIGEHAVPAEPAPMIT